jgi:hypothetical protein
MFFDKVQEHHHVLLALPPVLNLPYVWFDMLRMYFPCFSCASTLTSESRHVFRSTRTRSDPKANVPVDLSEATLEGSLRAESTALLLSENLRHVDVSKHAEEIEKDLAARSFDGRTLAEVYLAQQAELDSQTLLERTSALTDAMVDAKGSRDEFYCEAKTRLAKLEAWMQKEQMHREDNVDPANRDQTERIKRIEVCIGKVMDALSIKETVAEVQAPVIATKRRRHRNPASFMQDAFGNVERNVKGFVQDTGDFAAGLVPKGGIWNLNTQTQSAGGLLSQPRAASLSPEGSVLKSSTYRARESGRSSA